MGRGVLATADAKRRWAGPPSFAKASADKPKGNPHPRPRSDPRLWRGYPGEGATATKTAARRISGPDGGVNADAAN